MVESAVRDWVHDRMNALKNHIALPLAHNPPPSQPHDEPVRHHPTVHHRQRTPSPPPVVRLPRGPPPPFFSHIASKLDQKTHQLLKNKAVQKRKTMMQQRVVPKTPAVFVIPCRPRPSPTPPPVAKTPQTADDLPDYPEDEDNDVPPNTPVFIVDDTSGFRTDHALS